LTQIDTGGHGSRLRVVNNASMRLGCALARWIRCTGLALWFGAASVGAGEDLLWFDGGRPSAQAREAVELLSDAASHGLDPQDYAADALQRSVLQATSDPAPDAATIARLDQALTSALQRYLVDVHTGRVDPSQIHLGFTMPRVDPFDAAAALRAALASGRVADALRQAAPRVPQYERLRETLAQYRNLVDHTAWRQALPALPRAAGGGAAKLEPGQPYAGLALLSQRLGALGDLAPAQQAPSALYEATLVDAVRAFQRRHGLADDGVIGAATLVQLQVAPAARVRQIELALERLRWTPLLQGPRMIVINIPEFVLRAYEVRDGRIGVLQSMKIIVGKALDRRTPLFEADMRFIEFSPYWNVPLSIARAEVVPQLRRNSAVWAREGYEFVAADGEVDTVLSEEGLRAVLAGKQRIRQRPGARNPLGDIKFVFPNQENIYLHHTPSTRLFERERRDFSHGCIRVEQPVELAKFVLHDMPQWTEERIRQAMDKGESATLRLAEPVRVLIAYGTALVKDGRIHFFDDIYGQDRLLDAALRQIARDRQRGN
jgi:murein L,D-transpeptidase YcbB/YkuD